jgi:alkanesulfonate monooxygenase SsuD/methylene tetrahydromethanopterin reductase-like flavin-dependent oxidoreductase (luciferase family)
VRIGIVILPELRWAEAQHRWRRAEEYGFDHAWTYDHLGWRDLVDGPWFDAVPTLTAAATVTSRIRLGTLVASANFRHPVHFAREVTALDDISGGRLLLGLGSGGLGFDSEVLGRPPIGPRERVDRFGEFVELLDRLLTSDRTTWEGEHYSAVDARSTPGSVQQPRVPFVVAANGPRSMAIAARFGQAWITTGGKTDDLEAWWRSVGELSERFTAALDGAGRAPEGVDRHLLLDAAPRYSLSSVDAFTEAVGRARELGFTDAITHWPRPSSWYTGDESVLEEVATTVLAARGGGA